MDRQADYFIEAHSYDGGLKFTPFARSGSRPLWAPAADSVGWHDEFSLSDEDTVVELSKRVHDDNETLWIGVYRKSTDARFGDRGNHAGIGVWLLNYRIADAKPILSALYQYAVTLAAQPTPEVLSNSIADFSTPRFLESYLIQASELPADWDGAQGASSALSTTTFFEVISPDFERAAHHIAGAAVRWSLAWDANKLTPRALVRVSAAPTADAKPTFDELPAVDEVLADVILRVPQACSASLQAERNAQQRLAQREAEFSDKLADQQRIWDTEKRRLESIDGQPVSLEGIARLLNRLSADISELKAVRSAPVPVQTYAPPAVSRAIPRRSAVERARYDPEPQSTSFIDGDIALYLIVGALIIMVGILVYLFADKYLF